MNNDAVIKAVLSKNDTDLIITMQSYKMDTYKQAVLVQVYLYSPKLYNTYESWDKSITKILSDDLGLTETEIDTLTNIYYKEILDKSNCIAQISDYDIWSTRYDFLHALQGSYTLYYGFNNLKDIPVEKLKLIAGNLHKSIDYRTYKQLPDHEKALYSLKNGLSTNNVKRIILSYSAYRNELTVIESILNMLSNHIDNVTNISCDIYLDTVVDYINAPKMAIKLTKESTDNKLKVRETLTHDGKEYIANYIEFNKIDAKFDQMFKNIDSSIYLNTVLPFDKAVDEMNRQYKPVYEYTLKQSVIDDVLKSIANRYLQSGNDLQLSEYEKEIIRLSKSVNTSDFTENTIIDVDDYNKHISYIESKPNLYPDKDVSNKDLLHLLKEIYADLNRW